MTFNYLTSVTMLNMLSMDNSLTLMNNIKPLRFFVDGLSCGNTQLNLSGNDYSCIQLSDFSKINLTISNSHFFNKKLTNNYVIDASSD